MSDIAHASKNDGGVESLEGGPKVLVLVGSILPTGLILVTTLESQRMVAAIYADFSKGIAKVFYPRQKFATNNRLNSYSHAERPRLHAQDTWNKDTWSGPRIAYNQHRVLVKRHQHLLTERFEDGVSHKEELERLKAWKMLLDNGTERADIPTRY